MEELRLGNVTTDDVGGYVYFTLFVDEGEIPDETVEKIMAICHKWKHLYLDGYPHGRKTRLKMSQAGVTYEKWDNSPKVTISYWPTKIPDGLIVTAIASASAKKPKTAEELKLLAQMWQGEVLHDLEKVDII